MPAGAAVAHVTEAITALKEVAISMIVRSQLKKRQQNHRWHKLHAFPLLLCLSITFADLIIHPDYSCTELHLAKSIIVTLD